MSHQPIAGLSVVSVLGGITAFTRYNSYPSLIASLGIGGLMAISSMRIRDGLDYGYEGAIGSSLALVVPTFRRAVKTRGPVPVTVAVLATASTGYYLTEYLERHRERL